MGFEGDESRWRESGSFASSLFWIRDKHTDVLQEHILARVRGAHAEAQPVLCCLAYRADKGLGRNLLTHTLTAGTVLLKNSYWLTLKLKGTLALLR